MRHAAAVDINTFVGSYPFRHVPHPEPEALAGVMKREGIAHAIVGYLPAPWHRSCAEANDELFRLLASHSSLMSPAPCINAAWPGWQHDLDDCVERGAIAVRAYPPQWGDTSAASAAEIAVACAARDLPLILTTKFEDSRQRHWLDSCGDLSAAQVRAVARADQSARVILTCGGRALIEEIHWSLTPEERMRVWYDISWIWGPPQHDLTHLLRTIGPQRFLFGSMWPLRLVQTPSASLDLLSEDLRDSVVANAVNAMPLLAGALKSL